MGRRACSRGAQCEAGADGANDPCSSSTRAAALAKPKGILHGTGGICFTPPLTSKYVFDLKEHDIFLVHGRRQLDHRSFLPSCTGRCRTERRRLMFEGVPNFPSPTVSGRSLRSSASTSCTRPPTAVRSMMKDGDRWVNGQHDISTFAGCSAR